MKWYAAFPAIALLTLTINAAGALADGEAFYTRPPVFSTRPSSQTTLVQTVERFGPVGIGIDLYPPAFLMKVKNVEEGSPAAETGLLKAGQIIDSINGQKLHDIDPRIQLGNIITAAEASDGKVVFAVQDDDESPVQTVTVTIPVLGAYSPTWPRNCAKSDRIIRNLADHLAKGKGKLGGQAMLFLLSTGEEEDLDVVKQWVADATADYKPRDYSKNKIYQWHVGWQESAVAEYYLRTGDTSVFPHMENIAAAVRMTMYHDGWGGRGVPGHHMGIAGTSTLRFLLLARQCGVDVDEGMLQTALKHYSRYAGKGVNPYMDAHPEVTFTDNGRNGKLAFAMMSASALLPDSENDWYEMAAEIAAMHSFYSASYMLHGHTGGGIGEVWRSAAMGLMIDRKPNQYRDFMDQRRWFYDLSRRYNGGFGIVGGTHGYDKEQWGVTMGLTYTAPRKQLCMFGAPRSEYASYHEIPRRAWGTEGDDDFLNIDAAPDSDGAIKRWDHETVPEDSGLAFHRTMGAIELTDNRLIEYAHHPQHMYRTYVAHKIYADKRFHLIPELLEAKDARVRYVGVTAMPLPRVSSRPEKCDPGFPMEAMTVGVAGRLYEMLEHPDESWFVVDHILQLMSRREPAELAPHMDRIIHFLGHEEPWLRHAALKAIVPLALHKPTHQKALAAIEQHVPDFLRKPGGLSALAAGLKEAEPDIQKAGLRTLGRVYLAYPGSNTNPPGGRHPQSDTWYLDAVAGAISAAPGGLEKLYEVSKQRFPEASLVHRGSFLGALSLDDYGEELKQAIRQTILNDLIPEYMGKNRKKLLADAAGEKVQDAVSTLGGNGWRDGLSELYNKAGITDYDWHGFGPERDAIMWSYTSFDPPEKQKWESLAARFRPVTLPEGMKNWYAPDFDTQAAGWKTGRAPFASVDGEFVWHSGCTASFCRCGDEPNTFWQEEVILLRSIIPVPKIKAGHRYRLLLGGRSHVGAGDGYEIYLNGEKMFASEQGTGRRAGGVPKGYLLPQVMMEKLSGTALQVAVKTFWRRHPRSGQKRGYFTLFFEEMKIPPLTDELFIRSAEVIPMVCAEWQELQNPESTMTDPDEGKFRYDGTFVANPRMVGDWTVVGYVAGGQDVSHIKPVDRRFRALFTSISFHDNGRTDVATRIWSDGMLMNLDGFQALQMTLTEVDGEERLLVENGGFQTRNGPDWQSAQLVLKRK